MNGSIARPGPGGPRSPSPDRHPVTDFSPAPVVAPGRAATEDAATTRRDLLGLGALTLVLRLPTFFAVKHLTSDDGVFGASAVAMRNGGLPFRDVFLTRSEKNLRKINITAALSLSITPPLLSFWSIKLHFAPAKLFGPSWLSNE